MKFFSSNYVSMFSCKVLKIRKMGENTGWPITKRHFKGVEHLQSCVYIYIKDLFTVPPPLMKEKNKNVQSASQVFYKCERCVFATTNVKGCLFQRCDTVCVLGRGRLNPLASVPETLGSRTGGLSTGGPAVTSGDLAHFSKAWNKVWYSLLCLT